MPSIPNLSPLGANAGADDYVLVVQGGVTKRIKIKNLLASIANLSTGSFNENEAYIVVVRAGVPYKISLANWVASYTQSYDLGRDWVMLHYYEMRDTVSNPAPIVDFLGGTLSGGGGTFSMISPTVSSPYMTRCVPTATGGTGHYVMAGVDHGYSSKAAGAFFGVKMDAPAVNARISLGLTTGIVSGLLPVPLTSGGLLAAVVDTRLSQNWHLIISNNTNPAPFTTEVLDTGIALTNDYALVGVLWDPDVGLHFLCNNEYLATLTPADITKYHGMLLRPSYICTSVANGAASGFQLSNWYAMFKNA